MRIVLYSLFRRRLRYRGGRNLQKVLREKRNMQKALQYSGLLEDTKSYISALEIQVEAMKWLVDAMFLFDDAEQKQLTDPHIREQPFALKDNLVLKKATYSDVGSGSKMQAAALYADKEVTYNWITSETYNFNLVSIFFNILSVVNMGGVGKTTHAMGNATSFTQEIDDAIRSTTSSSLGDSPVPSYGSLIDSFIRSSSPSTTDNEFDAEGIF